MADPLKSGNHVRPTEGGGRCLSTIVAGVILIVVLGLGDPCTISATEASDSVSVSQSAEAGGDNAQPRTLVLKGKPGQRLIIEADTSGSGQLIVQLEGNESPLLVGTDAKKTGKPESSGESWRDFLIINAAKGAAIVIALLVLRWILGSLRGRAGRQDEVLNRLEQLLGELDARKAGRKE